MKPDYIPKEDITKELEEIEQNLNELEKRGVDLEVKLRKCEEGGMHSLAVCFSAFSVRTCCEFKRNLNACVWD